MSQDKKRKQRLKNLLHNYSNDQLKEMKKECNELSELLDKEIKSRKASHD